MPTFVYKGFDGKTAKTLKGMIDAPDLESAKATLRNRFITISPYGDYVEEESVYQKKKKKAIIEGVLIGIVVVLFLSAVASCLTWLAHRLLPSLSPAQMVITWIAAFLASPIAGACAQEAKGSPFLAGVVSLNFLQPQPRGLLVGWLQQSRGGELSGHGFLHYS